MAKTVKFHPTTIPDWLTYDKHIPVTVFLEEGKELIIGEATIKAGKEKNTIVGYAKITDPAYENVYSDEVYVSYYAKSKDTGIAGVNLYSMEIADMLKTMTELDKMENDLNEQE